jgi:DNA-binding transcriptional regulator YhcF (GntR family)
MGPIRQKIVQDLWAESNRSSSSHGSRISAYEGTPSGTEGTLVDPPTPKRRYTLAEQKDDRHTRRQPDLDFTVQSPCSSTWNRQLTPMSADSTPIVRRRVDLDPSADMPLHKQLYRDLRQAILSSQLLPEMQLPPTRTLADELGVSRTTVLNAFDQLKAEGYLDSHVGSGTYVAQELPDDLDRVRGMSHLRPTPFRRSSGPPAESHLSDRGQLLTDLQLSSFQADEQPRAFRPGLPALDAFPIDTWSRLTSRRWRSLHASSLGYLQSYGFPPAW